MRPTRHPPGARCIELTTYAHGPSHPRPRSSRCAQRSDDGLLRAGARRRGANFAKNQQQWVEDLAANGADVSWKRDFPRRRRATTGAHRAACAIEESRVARSAARSRSISRIIFAPCRLSRTRCYVRCAHSRRPDSSALEVLLFSLIHTGSQTTSRGMRCSTAWTASKRCTPTYEPVQRDDMLSFARARNLLTSCGRRLVTATSSGNTSNPGFEASPELL